MRVIPTRDSTGHPNGYVMPLWNAREDDWRPDQVYLTVIAPGKSKGPHLHRKRVGRFFCVGGLLEVITRVDGAYISQTGERMIEVAPGVPAELHNPGPEPALVINMPTPGWAADDQDEYPVDDWRP